MTLEKTIAIGVFAVLLWVITAILIGAWHSDVEETNRVCVAGVRREFWIQKGTKPARGYPDCFRP